eukprot:jgi/Orpsp1_1/1189918/evm.model.d7180000075448.1
MNSRIPKQYVSKIPLPLTIIKKKNTSTTTTTTTSTTTSNIPYYKYNDTNNNIKSSKLITSSSNNQNNINISINYSKIKNTNTNNDIYNNNNKNNNNKTYYYSNENDIDNDNDNIIKSINKFTNKNIKTNSYSDTIILTETEMDTLNFHESYIARKAFIHWKEFTKNALKIKKADEHYLKSLKRKGLYAFQCQSWFIRKEWKLEIRASIHYKHATLQKCLNAWKSY